MKEGNEKTKLKLQKKYALRFIGKTPRKTAFFASLASIIDWGYPVRFENVSGHL